MRGSKREQNKIQNAFNNNSSVNSLGPLFGFPSLFAAWVQQTPTWQPSGEPWGPDNPDWPLQGDMQTSVTCLMELQEDHQLNCPLIGCGVPGGQNTPVVFPSWCPTKMLQFHNAALSSALLSCSFSGIVGGLLCIKIFRFFRRVDINYTASGVQLVVSCEVKGRDIIH